MPTLDDVQTYYESLPEEQKPKFIESSILKIINGIYLDGADRIELDEEPEEGSIYSGFFYDEDMKFEFQLSGEEVSYRQII